MTKAELESKHLAELHALAAEQEIPRYRMLPRPELIEKLASGDGKPEAPSRKPEAPSRQRRSRGGSRGGGRSRERTKPAEPSPPAPKPQAPKPAPAAETTGGPAEAAPSRPRRRRRRRRPFGRKGAQEVSVHDLLLPPAAGRQVIVHAETRAACTALLREIATELEGDSKGPDPVVLIVDPSPEELADWRRDTPKAEIVAAGQARHADDALAQAANRAGSGEDVILLVDSLSRLGEAYGEADAAKRFFDAGQGIGGSGGSLTVVVAVERRSRG